MFLQATEQLTGYAASAKDLLYFNYFTIFKSISFDTQVVLNTLLGKRLHLSLGQFARQPYSEFRVKFLKRIDNKFRANILNFPYIISTQVTKVFHPGELLNITKRVRNTI
jgi:hypothetical protein